MTLYYTYDRESDETADKNETDWRNAIPYIAETPLGAVASRLADQYVFTNQDGSSRLYVYGPETESCYFIYRDTKGELVIVTVRQNSYQGNWLYEKIVKSKEQAA